MYQSFTGKVILFGEYSIIAGSRALVIPLQLFSGKLAIPGGNSRLEQEAKQSNIELREFLKYLSSRKDKEKLSLSLNFERLVADLNKGLYFQSSIPLKYGAGSSAALVAAVYDACAINKIDKGTENTKDLSGLKDSFSEMESYFHGTSSGIDPLCSYTGRNLIFDHDSVRQVSLSPLPEDTRLFLFDSGLTGNTGPLVSDFRSRMANEPDFARIINNDLSSLVERGIKCLSGETVAGLRDLFRELSIWQLENFDSMIPGTVKRDWKNGLDTGVYYSKLCGSGGGGFFLGFTEQWEETKRMFSKSGLVILPLDL